MGHNNFIAIYDKGYHTGREFEYANRLGVDVLVAIPGVSAPAPDTAFDVEYFKYNKTTDSYTCPANETLTTNENWYGKKERQINNPNEALQNQRLPDLGTF